MKKTIKRCIDIALAFLLIFLFTVPRIWLNGVCTEMTEQTQMASAALRTGSDHTPYLRELERLFERSAPKMRLFLDHGAVDEVGAAIGVCVPYATSQDLLSALNAVSAAITHLGNIESFQWDSIF